MSSRNPGIIRLAKDATVLHINDPDAVAAYAKRTRVELAVIGPEAPLINGAVNALNKLGIACVGPTRTLASIEGDKTFCRGLLSKHAIPGNPKYRIFADIDAAEAYLKQSGPVAIKPVGLTGGKGVKTTGADLPTKTSEVAYAKEILQNKMGGFEKVLVEERLDGEEYSLQAFVDGKNLLVMPLVQDHKRAYDNDSGPNTGGMGSYSDYDHMLPFVSRTSFETSSLIMCKVVDALRKDMGEEYRGILYGQFMIARGEGEEKPSPKLIEFNCRFGDPEVMNVLPILSQESNFLELCQDIATGTLKTKEVSFQQKATVCKYLVPAGYPNKPSVSQPVSVGENALKKKRALVFYASVDMKNSQILTTASRAIAVVGVDDNIEAAERIAEAATLHVKGPLEHRRDIGTTGLIRKRVDHVKSLGVQLTKVTHGGGN
jgi:phosphoribosylamine--glycine ligase